MSDARQSSHRQILRATSIIGGASALNVLIGLVRVKVLAVLLGPAGVGLVGLYSTIMSTTATLASLGLSFSGVRQVAEASATGDSYALTVVRKTLWRTSLTLGTLGALLLWLLSNCKKITHQTLRRTSDNLGQIPYQIDELLICTS